MGEKSVSVDSLLPVLDAKPYLAGATGARETLAADLRHALENIGFYILTNHGVPDGLIGSVLAATRAFHAQPLDAKMVLAANEHNVGYMPLNASTSRASQIAGATEKPNFVAAYFLKRDLPPDHPDVLANKRFRPANPWPAPEALPGFREAVVAYCAAMEALCLKMLPVYALALDLPPDFFDEAFREPQYTLRMSHYPPAETGEAGQFGVSPHTDSSFLTMLAQTGQSGLQVRLPESGWCNVPARPGTIVVNSGDMLRRWTNHRFLSTPHRAINPTAGADRYAFPFFFDATADFPMACPPTCCGPDNPPRYEPITYTDYMLWFTRRNYDHVRAKDGTVAADPGVPATQSDRGWAKMSRGKA